MFLQEYEIGLEQMKVEQIKQQGEERRKNMQQDARIKKEVRTINTVISSISAYDLENSVT